MEDKKICKFQNLCWLYGITNDKKIIVEPFIFNFNKDKIKFLISDKIVKAEPGKELTVPSLKRQFKIGHIDRVMLEEENNSICLKVYNENLFVYKYNPLKIYTLQEIKDITKNIKHQLEKYASEYYKIVGEGVKLDEYGNYVNDIEKDTFNF